MSTKIYQLLSFRSRLQLDFTIKKRNFSVIGFFAS